MDILFIQALNDAFANSAEKFTAAELPPVAHIDKFRGQPLNPEIFEGFELPAVFYNLRCRWTKNGKQYDGDMMLEFHVVQDATWETSNISTNAAIGLKQMKFLSLVRSVLDNVTSANTGKLTRVEDTPVDSGVTIYDVLNYSGPYYDPTIVGSGGQVDVVPNLKMDISVVTKL